MKKISLLFLMAIFAISCSKDESRSEKKVDLPNVDGMQSVEASLPAENENAVQNQAEGKGVPPKPGKLYAPPKPATKGLYDFSECKAKHPEGSEAYKDCVKAKYPNLKFAGEEKVDPDVEMKIEKEMEKEAFKNLKKEQNRYNDSLARLDKRTGPRQPGPEGVLRNLMIKCKERGDCPHE